MATFFERRRCERRASITHFLRMLRVFECSLIRGSCSMATTRALNGNVFRSHGSRQRWQCDFFRNIITGLYAFFDGVNMLQRNVILATRSFSRTGALGTSATVKNWIDGKEVESKTSKWIDLTNPVRLLLFITIISMRLLSNRQQTRFSRAFRIQLKTR